MKRLLLLLIPVILCSAKCKKDGVPDISDTDYTLPAATHSGMGTLGFTLNGKVIIPKGAAFGAPPIVSRYILNTTTGDAFDLTISASNSKIDPSPGIVIRSKNIDLKTGDILPLTLLNSSNAASAQYNTITGGNLTYYDITPPLTGQLQITYLDKSIIAGTFSFDAVNSKGEKVEVRDGRFDLRIDQ